VNESLESVLDARERLAHRPAQCVGRMRGEHDRYAQVLDRARDRIARHALAIELPEQRRQRAGLAGAMDAGLVALLADVREPEEEREGARDLTQRLRLQSAQPPPQAALLFRREVAAQPAGELAQLDHLRQKSLALLLADDGVVNVLDESELALEDRIALASVRHGAPMIDADGPGRNDPRIVPAGPLRRCERRQLHTGWQDAPAQ
jgi:hypothetical protein